MVVGGFLPALTQRAELSDIYHSPEIICYGSRHHYAPLGAVRDERKREKRLDRISCTLSHGEYGLHELKNCIVVFMLVQHAMAESLIQKIHPRQG
ncbi:hypothetical protein IG631_12919 [Alternaria alternata]|nr:hypothetical protein IG631_12919 [Alternaria alternata]